MLITCGQIVDKFLLTFVIVDKVDKYEFFQQVFQQVGVKSFKGMIGVFHCIHTPYYYYYLNNIDIGV